MAVRSTDCVPSLRILAVLASAMVLPNCAFAEIIFQPGDTVLFYGNSMVERLGERCVRELAAFKRPVEIRVVERFPVGPTGKVRRAAVRAGLAAELTGDTAGAAALSAASAAAGVAVS
jgi:acyl-CoA synthetase (AMP-forming)/AMP-acid ligase II